MDELEKEFLEHYRVIAVSQGMDRQVTDIMGLVMISDEPLSLEEISRKTGYSLASISQKVSMFASFGIVEKTRKPGSRKVYVRSKHSAIDMWADAIENKSKGLKQMLKGIPGFIEKYNKKRLDAHQKIKLSKVEDFYNNLRIVDHILDDMLIRFRNAERSNRK